MSNAAGHRTNGKTQKRRRRAWRPWSWCTECNEHYFYHHQVKSDTLCRRCAAALQPQLQRHQGQEARGDAYLEQAQMANVREQHFRAAVVDDTARAASLEATFPVLDYGQLPPPKSALAQPRQAPTQAMQAQRKLDNAIDWAATLRVQLEDAVETALKTHVEAQVADEEYDAAKWAHARTCKLPTQQARQSAPSPTATAVFGCDLQGLEQDEDIRAALAHFQHLQQAFVQQVQAKRAAASPAPTLVPAASSLGGTSTASGPPAVQPDFHTPDAHQMGDAERGTHGDADPGEDEQVQHVKHARVQLLADVQSAGDEQWKQLAATSQG